MPVLTIILGAVATLLSVMDFAHGNQFAQLPAAFGVVMFIVGFFALTKNQKKRAAYMHGAVILALLGFLSTVWWVVEYVQMSLGHRPFSMGIEEHALASLVYLLFVLLCIRSFVNARRTRARA